MQYNPGITYHGDAYIADAGRNLAQMIYGTLSRLGEEYAQAKQRRDYALGQQAGYEGLPDVNGTGGDQDGGGGEPEQEAGGGGGLDAAGNPMGGAAPEQAAQSGKRAHAIRQLIATYAPENKDLQAATKGWSTAQLEGFVQGQVMRRQGQNQRMLALARYQDMLAQADQRREMAAADAATGQAWNAYATAPEVADESAVGGFRPPTHAERMLNAMQNAGGGRYGWHAMKVLADYGKTLQEADPKAGQTVTDFFTPGQLDAGVPKELQGKYVRVPVGPKSAQLVSLDPGKPLTYQETDEEGNPVGPRYVKTNTGWKREEDPGAGPTVSPDGKMYWSGTGWRPMRAPTSAEALKETLTAGKGSERVTVMKGGKRFTVPRAQVDAAKKQGYTVVE